MHPFLLTASVIYNAQSTIEGVQGRDIIYLYGSRFQRREKIEEKKKRLDYAVGVMLKVVGLGNHPTIGFYNSRWVKVVPRCKTRTGVMLDTIQPLSWTVRVDTSMR